jgi:sialate O-acetylesterase
MKIYLYSILFIFSITNQGFSQTSLSGFFSDNMVLQQKQETSIWGKDVPEKKIMVTGSWGSNAETMSDKNGKWKLKLQTPSAGGPYLITVKGSSEINIKNVLIGEVWLCSGQSNMEMPVKGYLNQPVIGSNETILNSNNDKIRYYNAPRLVSIKPVEEVKGNWKVAQPATTGNFSASAYFFAKKLNDVLGIPIGIIQTSWGGSTIESWMDKETLSNFSNKIIPEKVPDSFPNRTPTILYNSLLYPYIGYTLKGMIWYQGESNRENANEYIALFTSLITSWRNQWQQGDFPFYFTQIAPFGGGKINAAYLREAQLQTMLTVKNTGMAVTLDIGEQNNIHPSQKELVGNRLAYWALVKDYKIEGISFCGPIYKDMEIKNNKIILKFDYCDQGLTTFGKPLTEFEIATEDKIFYPAQAMINKDVKGRIIVWNDSIKNPLHVRYGFKSWTEGNLFNTNGLPASSFRTDNW